MENITLSSRLPAQPNIRLTYPGAQAALAHHIHPHDNHQSIFEARYVVLTYSSFPFATRDSHRLKYPRTPLPCGSTDAWREHKRDKTELYT